MVNKPAQMNAETSIVRVGDGRGFVVADMRHEEMPPLVITAAHCLPQMPAAYLARCEHEQTFQLLAPLKKTPSVYATVLFYDPIADLAVLGQPDNQSLCTEADEYENLLAEYIPLRIAVPRKNGRGFVYDVTGTAQPITYRCWQGSYKTPWVHVEGFTFMAGMSGSPIFNTHGQAIAAVSTSGSLGNIPSPCLSEAIPSRIRLRILRSQTSR